MNFRLKSNTPVFVVFFISILFSACSKNGANPTPKATVTISSLSANSGSFGTSVTITGTGFSTALAENKVLFNNVATVVLAATSTQITTTVPMAAGTGTITINVNGNTATGPVFTYQQTLVVTTFAGQPGSGTTFFQPQGIAADSTGNVYVPDQNNLIRKITPTGVVSILAGSGAIGTTDGSGTSASFSHPYGIATDRSGNVYVCDNGGSLIRKISSSGVVTTLAGNGRNEAVDGTGNTASFARAAALTVDALGNVFVADQGATQIRKITPAGVVTTLFSGTGSFSPYGLTIDKNGNIFVADLSNSIDKINSSGKMTVFAGGSFLGGFVDGTGTQANFYGPDGITIDANGNLFVIDFSKHIRKVTPDAVVTTFSGNGTSVFDGPIQKASYMVLEGITVDKTGVIYIIDNGIVKKISYQ